MGGMAVKMFGFDASTEYVNSRSVMQKMVLNLNDNSTRYRTDKQNITTIKKKPKF